MARHYQFFARFKLSRFVPPSLRSGCTTRLSLKELSAFQGDNEFTERLLHHPDLERAIGFYRDVLGFEVTQRYGTQAAFLSAGGYHHHIGLNTWESQGGSPPPQGTTGLFHVAILYPTRAELADALRRLHGANITLDGASDHGVSEALYLRDPDGNGVELYWDRPIEEWPRTAIGELNMVTEPLNLDELLQGDLH